MTRPGPPPSRGRHAAPDDDARPEDRHTGRHAAPDPPPRRHAAPEEPPDPYPQPPADPYAGPAARRYAGSHAGPDAEPHPGQYGGSRLGPEAEPRHGRYGGSHDGPDAEPRAGRYGVGPDGELRDGWRYGGSHAGSYVGPDDGARSGTHAGGYAGRYEWPGPGPYAGPYAGPAGGRDGGSHAGPDEPHPGRYGGTYAEPYERPAAGRRAGLDGPDVGGGRHAAGGGPNGRASQAGGYGRHLAEPGGEPADGFGDQRPDTGDAAGWAGEHPPAQPWGQLNGYHLETPAPPTVNGYRLDEPVAPVTGFPYTAPPSAPIAYPVNGHGVDAAEREAGSWPVNGHATELDRPPADPRIAVVPLDDEPTQSLARPARAPDRPPADPRIAVVPLDDEPTQSLARPAPAPDRPADAPPTHPPRAVVRRRRARRKALEWPLLIVFALVSAFLIRQYVVQTFYIPSGSMHETLLEGDRVLVNKVGYHLHDIHRGDIVVFVKPPNLNVSEDDLIKRVIALPGETVEGRGGKVYVNGAALDEPYVEPLCHGTTAFPKVTVPAGRLWVMGDNRCNSSDSRVFGPIGRDLVVGRAFLLAWPFDRLSWL